MDKEHKLLQPLASSNENEQQLQSEPPRPSPQSGHYQLLNDPLNGQNEEAQLDLIKEPVPVTGESTA